MNPRQWRITSSRTRRVRIGLIAAALTSLFALNQLSVTTLYTASDISSETITTRRRRYHSWDANGSDLGPVLKRLNCTWSDECVENPLENSNIGRKLAVKCQPFPAFIAMSNNPQQQQHPGLFFSTHITRLTGGCAMANWKTVGKHLPTALRTQLPQHLERFPALVKALKQFPLIPFYVEFTDYRGCPDPSRENRYDEIKQIGGMPYMSICKSTNCPWGFPIPTYMDYEMAELAQQQQSEGQGGGGWAHLMQEWNRTYPWHDKIPKATWRGGIKNFRAAVLQETEKLPLFFDVQAVHGKHPKQPKEASMQYKVVLDMDGNSWSERFPRLLCYNSAVIVVVAPDGIDDYEEYLMQDLVPNVHFIPASVENLTTVVENVLDGNNDDFLQSIVREANAFCRARLVTEELNLDFLSVLNGYVETLDAYDKDWIVKWQQVHSSYVGPGLGHGGFNDGPYWAESLSNPPKWNLTETHLME